MGQKYKRFREFRTPLSLRDIHKNPRSMYARVPQAMAQFVLKIEKLSHIMGPTPILEMARAYGLRPRLWLLRQIRVGQNDVTQTRSGHQDSFKMAASEGATFETNFFRVARTSEAETSVSGKAECILAIGKDKTSGFLE